MGAARRRGDLRTAASSFRGSKAAPGAAGRDRASARGRRVAGRHGGGGRVSDRTGARPRPACGALGAVVRRAGRRLVGSGSAFTTPGARRPATPAASRIDPAYFAVLVALVDLHREPHRRDRPRVDPGRAARARARRPTRSRSRASSGCGTWCSRRRSGSPIPPIGNQYLNLTRTRRSAAVISFSELTQVTQTTVANRSPAVPAFTLRCSSTSSISLVMSAIVNIANRRLALVER